VRVEGGSGEHPEMLLDRALRGELDPAGRARLERHLARCPDCAAEMEGARVLGAATGPGRHDDSLNRAAVELALQRLGQPGPWGARLRRWFDLGRLWRPATALVGAAALAAIVFVVVEARRPALSTSGPAASARPFVLADGSEITAVAGTTAIQIAEQTPSRTTVRLRSGSAQFRVRHDSRRVFRVDAGLVEIEDLGTVFRVTHEAANQIRVAVTEGRVAVVYPVTGLRFEVGEGEDRVFSPLAAPSVAMAAPTVAPKPPAPAMLTARGQPRPRGVEDPAELLNAADGARRAGRPQAAVVPLRRLVERYPKDPRAPAAAFTLGWVLLTDLGRAREAASAFAEAERIAPRGALAEDAAARVAEAWQKAGDLGRAAQAARHYEQIYPTGRYIALMHGLVRPK
jgi:ferric-dicitrate binding protein FerR (iron transport regulator)